MKQKLWAFKLLAILMVLLSTKGWGQTTIAVQDFEPTPTTPTWTYSTSGGTVGVNTTANRYNGSQSLRITGTSTITFSNIDISGYTNVNLNVSFASVGADSGEDLYMDISYDNGGTWVGAGSVQLVDGYSNASLNITHLPAASNPMSVGSPYNTSIGGSNTQIAVRFRSNTGSSEYYFLDDVKLTGTALPTCTTATHSFASATVNKLSTDPAFTNTFTTNNTSQTAYSSSDPGVATVNNTTGEVTMVGAGSTTISVTQAADGTYCAVNDSYTLEVTSAAPHLNISGSTDLGSACLYVMPGNTQSYTITNTGGSAATGVMVISDNPQFTIENFSQNATITANGGTVTFDVRFVPVNQGVQNATISVISTGSNYPTLGVSGTGNAPTAATLSTSAATNVSNTGVQFNGTINSLGSCPETVEKGFVYATTANPTIANFSTSAGSAPITMGPYSFSLGGTLTPGTTYYYRAYAKDANDNYVYGSDQSFTTTLAAPVATAASAITSGGFTANWNAVTGADSYMLEVNKVVGSSTPDITVVGWNFDDENITADLGQSVNLNKTITTTGGTITYSAGLNSSQAASANSWASGANSKYWKVNFVTTGITNIRLSSAQRASNTGPKNFKVQYSLDDSNWFDVSGATVTLADNFTTGVLNNISLPSAIDNKSVVYLRWIMTSNISVNDGTVSSGSSRIENILIIGDQSSLSNAPITGSPFTVSAPATSYVVAGLDPSSNYNYTVKAVKGALNSIASNVINVTTDVAPASTTYAGGSWSNGAPNSLDTDAIINENYSGAGFTADNVTVNSGASLTVLAGQTITANNVTVQDNANLIQQDTSTLTINGTFTLNKASTSTTNIFDLWSSPVVSQGMDDIFTANGSIVREYNTATDTYTNVGSPTSVFGKGYAVRGTGTDVTATFTGTPNNGTHTLPLVTTLSTNGNRYNLVGNPYPSNFNLITFYNANEGDGSTTGIDPTMYFYNSSAATDKWGTFNALATGTWARANAATTETSVKPGQAFFVSARSASTDVTFDNSMRNSNTAVFVNKAASSTTEGKYWLELTTPSNNTTGFAVTYGYGASNNFDLYDSKMMSTGTDAFYTYLGTEKLAIQGRDYFVSTDVVTLGNKHSVAGQYTISLVNKIGLFTAGQPIYLHDKELGTYTDLQTGNYSFTTNALEQQNRFEIVYQTSALGTAENVKTETKVYRDGEYFVVEASEKITGIEVYDASGRLVLTQQPNRMNARLLISSKGMYVIHIKTVKSETSKKVIK